MAPIDGGAEELALVGAPCADVGRIVSCILPGGFSAVDGILGVSPGGSHAQTKEMCLTCMWWSGSSRLRVLGGWR